MRFAWRRLATMWIWQNLANWRGNPYRRDTCCAKTRSNNAKEVCSGPAQDPTFAHPEGNCSTSTSNQRILQKVKVQRLLNYGTPFPFWSTLDSITQDQSNRLKLTHNFILRDERWSGMGGGVERSTLPISKSIPDPNPTPEFLMHPLIHPPALWKCRGGSYLINH